MHPTPDQVVVVDPKLLAEEEYTYAKPVTPAEKLENSRVVSGVISVAGVIYLVYYFATGGFNLTLNIVNFIFLIPGHYLPWYTHFLCKSHYKCRKGCRYHPAIPLLCGYHGDDDG